MTWVAIFAVLSAGWMDVGIEDAQSQTESGTRDGVFGGLLFLKSILPVQGLRGRR
jgi:hypothetical protein